MARKIVLILGLVILSVVFIYPILQGLVLLPLDLLVSNYSPWHWASTILLKNSYMQDSIIQLFPWRHLTFESLMHGIVPFWNPYQFAGMPFMASMKPMVWYPLNLLFPFGEIVAWHGLLVFQLFGSLFFMYLFVHDLGLRRGSAIVAGISFAFSSLMIGVLEFGSDGNTLVWLPLLLFLVKRYVDKKSGIYLLLLGISTACVIFAGHLQYLAYEFIMVASFLVVYGRSKRTKLETYMRVFLSFLFGFGVSAIQLIPSLEMFKYSYRGIGDSFGVFSGDLLQPYHLLRLLAPDFFGNPLSHDLHISYIEASGYFGVIPLFLLSMPFSLSERIRSLVCLKYYFSREFYFL